MKKLLLFMMLCLASFSMVKADDLTVAVGSVSSTYLPIYGLYVDTEGTRGQCLYPADSLTEMAGGSISSLTFYLASPAAEAWTGTIEVSLGETADASLSGIITDGLTTVYTGTLDATGSTMTVEFDEAYTYSGENLIVDMLVTIAGNYKGATFSAAALSGAGCYLYAYGGGVQNVLPTVTFEFEAGEVGPRCEKPSSIAASDVTANTATITWADGSGVFNVEYKAGEGEWISLLEETTQTSIELTDLIPTTNYQVRVQSFCNNLDTVSGWRSCKFKTAIGLPFSEDFEASTSLPAEWVQYSGLLEDILSGSATLSSSSYGWSISSTSFGIFNSKHLYSNIYGSSSKKWVVMPAIPMEDNVQLTFDFAITGSGGSALTPGAQDDDKFAVLATTDDGATWVVLRQWDNAGSDYVFDNINSNGEEVAIDLSSLAGESVRIAFYGESTSGPSSGAGDNYIHIDNVLIDYIPRCLKPTDLAVSGITKDAALLEWTANNNETEWLLNFKKADEEGWTVLSVSSNPFLLSDLEPYTTYQVCVAASCDQIDEFGTSRYSQEVSFKTAAGVPFTESFNDAMPAEWKRYSGLLELIQSGDTALVPVSSGWTVGTGNGVFTASDKHLKLNIYGASCQSWILSPRIELEDNVRLSFDLALTQNSGTLEPVEAGSQDDDKFVVLISTNDGESWEELVVRDNVSSEDAFDNINCSANGQNILADLSDFAGESIILAFYGESTVAGGNNCIHIDNVRIEFIPSCEKPVDLTVGGLSDASATFTWAEPEDGSTPEWQYGFAPDTIENFVPQDEDFTGTTAELSVTIDELQENTEYVFFLRTDCDGALSEPVIRKFKTFPLPKQVPWTEDFEAYDPNTIIEYWDNSGSATTTAAGSNTHYVWGVYAYGGNQMIRMYNYYVSSGTALINTPRIELPAEPAYELTFDYAHTATCGDFLLKISDNGGASWTTMTPSYGKTSTGTDKDNPGEFSTATVNLESFAGSTIMLQFFATANYGSGSIFVDNIDIHEVPDCLKPLSLVEVAENNTPNSVQLDWEPQGSETQWLIQYKKLAEEDWTLFDGDVDAHPFDLTGLDAASVYNVRVAAWCDTDDSLAISDFSSAIRATTACDAISAFPFSENFDGIEGTTSGSVNILPTCWSYINTCSNTSYNGYPNIYTGASYAASGSNSLKLYSYAYYASYDPQDQYAILPEMEGISALRIRFSARAYMSGASYDAAFVVGVMSDPADVNTFVPVANLEPAGTTYEPFEVKFNTYAGNGKFIAIKLFAADPDADDYIHGLYIDNVIVDSIPSCYEPAGITVINVTASEADFVYEAEEGDVLYYAVAAADSLPAEYIAVEADTIHVSGLNENSDYVIYLRKQCASGFSLPIEAPFHTKQLPVDLPYIDDFESGNSWLFINGDLENAWVYGAATNGLEEGTHALYISNDGGASHAYTNNKNVSVFATKAFNFTEGSYTFRYEWLADGESTYDYMRVALVPASVELEASTSIPTGIGTTSLPTGWIALDGGSKLNQVTSWQIFTSEEIFVQAGVYNVVLFWRDDTSSGSNPPAAVDNFSITKVACGKPENLRVSDITPNSALLAWGGDEDQNAWHIALSTDAQFSPDSVVLFAADTNPFTLYNLEEDTTYYVYVRAHCGEGIVSAWSNRFSFNTAKECQLPDEFVLDSVTTSMAVISWTTYGQSLFNFSYSTDEENWIDLLDVTMPLTLNDLDPSTQYLFKVQPVCADSGEWTEVYSFRTVYGVPFAEDFILTSAPDGWAQAKGLLSDIMAGGEFSSGSMWSFGAANGVFDNHARLNIYGSDRKHWLFTPQIAIQGNVQLSFDLALTQFSGTLAPVGEGSQADDKFVVLISNDNAASWTILRQWDNAGSQYVYDNIACSAVGEPVAIDLSAYDGQSVYIAFYGESTLSGGDNNLHIDNVLIDVAPACPKSTGLHIAALSDTLVTLAWDAEEDVVWEFGLVIDTIDGFIPQDSDFIATVAINEVTIGPLAPQTAYLFFMRKVCGEDKSEVLFKSFRTIQTAEALPFADDFENGNSWLLINGSIANAWVVGTAVNNTQDGANALYISNDGGLNNEYTMSIAAMVYASKTFHFAESGSYEFKYDWMANGESNYDFLRVALTPATLELEASTSVISGFGATSLPNGWIALDGGSKLNLSTEWATFTDTVQVVAGYYNVVFAWRNDNSTGAQNAAAVDNVSIMFVQSGTGFEGNAAVESKAVKFFRNGHVYILVNGVVYDATGRKVK